MGSILDLPLSKQVDAITTGAIRPEELLVTARQRAERVNDKLHAIVAMDETGACRQLDRAPRGRLFGVPIGIKDSIALPWRAPQDGMRAPAPTSTARAGTAVQQLQRAGALPAFATAMHQLGMGTTGHVSASGPVLNPADTTKLAGGSSGGSAAAVAAGAVPAALGTDAGGSIRIPSAYCG
ncbi:MAG: amidase, partial [Comamonadaceae bacterium]